MSSKSRKSSQPSPQGSSSGSKVPATQGAHKAAKKPEVEPAEPTAKDFLDAEELLKIPRGRSKLTYAFLIFLLIVLTAVFVVLDVVNPGSSGGRGGTPVAFDRPGGAGRMEFSGVAVQGQVRLFGETLSMITGQRGSSLGPAQVAELILMDELARSAGIRVTDNELRETLRPLVAQLGGPQAYQEMFRGRRGISVAEFESTLRRLMRVEKLRSLGTYLGSLPDPAAVEALWNEQRRELAFDYVVVETAAYQDAARAEAPEDAVLEAWLADQSESRRNRFLGPARIAAEVAGVRLGPDALQQHAALLEAYPDADDVDLEARTRRFYDEYHFARYTVPPGEDEERLYFAFEEVAEQAAIDARLLAALRAWHAELRARIANAGSESAESAQVDLAFEAERLGLIYEDPGTPRTAAEWREAEGLRGIYVGSQVMRLDPGQLGTSVIVDRDVLAVVRVTNRVPASLPPFAEIRDGVLDLWVEDRAKELALAELEGLRARLVGVGPEDEGWEDAAPVEREAFEELSAAAGLELMRRDWLDRRAPLTDDPGADLPGHRWLRAQAGLGDLEEGTLALPGLSSDGRHAVLARLAGRRAVPIERMQPADFANLRRQAAEGALFEQAFSGGGPFSLATLAATYNLSLPDEGTTELLPDDEFDNDLGDF